MQRRQALVGSQATIFTFTVGLWYSNIDYVMSAYTLFILHSVLCCVCYRTGNVLLVGDKVREICIILDIVITINDRG